MIRTSTYQTDDKPLVIDCVTHCLTGPAIIAAAGILADGTLLRLDAKRIPLPALLILPAGSADKKVGVIRVALSKIFNKETGKHRTFGLQFGAVVQAPFMFKDSNPMFVDMMVMRFTAGNRMMQMASVLEGLTLGGRR